MSQFIRVVLGLPDGMMYWAGDYLSDFPFFTKLNDEDLTSWQKWAASPPVIEFVDETIVRCQMQAMINKEAQSYATVKTDTQVDEYSYGLKRIDNPLKDKQ